MATVKRRGRPIKETTKRKCSPHKAGTKTKIANGVKRAYRSGVSVWGYKIDKKNWGRPRIHPKPRGRPRAPRPRGRPRTRRR